MTMIHGTGALLQHAYLQLLDYSLYEERPKLHPLQALLGQADGVEDGSSNPVPLLCFRWRALLHNALENINSTHQKGSMCTAHTEGHPITFTGQVPWHQSAAGEFSPCSHSPGGSVQAICSENSGGDHLTHSAYHLETPCQLGSTAAPLVFAGTAGISCFVH